jgi:hypothetical protein
VYVATAASTPDRAPWKAAAICDWLIVTVVVAGVVVLVVLVLEHAARVATAIMTAAQRMRRICRSFDCIWFERP